MSQRLGKKGRRKWQHSHPQQHISREKAMEVCNDKKNAQPDPVLGIDGFWEHVRNCRHCKLIWEDVVRKTNVRTKSAEVDNLRHRRHTLLKYKR